MLAEWAPGPRLLCYLVGLVPTLLLGLMVLRVPDVARTGGVWRIRIPSVPRHARGRFTAAALTGAAGWGIGGLFLSVIPTYAATLLGTHNLALLGAIAGLLLATACVAQLASMRANIPSAVGQCAGL